MLYSLKIGAVYCNYICKEKARLSSTKKVDMSQKVLWPFHEVHRDRQDNIRMTCTYLLTQSVRQTVGKSSRSRGAKIILLRKVVLRRPLVLRGTYFAQLWPGPVVLLLYFARFLVRVHLSELPSFLPHRT